MAVSYKKLWKLLIDRNLKKKDLEEMAGVSHYTMNKLTRDNNVTVDVLEKVCRALGCSLDEIMEFVDNWIRSLARSRNDIMDSRQGQTNGCANYRK